MKSINWRVVVAAAVAPILLSASPARAGEWSFGGAAGPFMPGQGSGPVNVALDDGYAYELRAGWQLTPLWSVDGAVGGLDAERTLPAANVSWPTLHSVAGEYALVTGRVTTTLGTQRWRLSAGAGTGWYSMDLHVKEPPATERRFSDDGVGYHITGGARFAVTPHAGIGFDARWTDLDDLGIDGGSLLLGVDYLY